MNRRHFLALGVAAGWTAAGGAAFAQEARQDAAWWGARTGQADLDGLKKIDIHTHIATDADYLREVMDALNLKMFTICNEGLKVDRLAAQIEAARRIVRRAPRYYAWATTFGFDGLHEEDWAERVITSLADDFEHGALGLKVWKEIGMQVRHRDGVLVQIDDPMFEPVFRFVANEGKTLFAHIGDPVRRWLSFDEAFEYDGWYREGAGPNNRVGSFRGQVSFDTMIRARDRVLARHPDLRVIGCHMASLEFDVDLVAERLDRYPNLAVETSSVMHQLMGQAREKVRSFFLRYPDRIIYGADISGGLIPTPYLIDMSRFQERMSAPEIAQAKDQLLQRYRRDFAYYATDLPIANGDYTVKGLALPESVLRKVLYENAVQWVPGIDRAF